MFFMRALIQRVRHGAVTVADQTVGEIGMGLVVLLGVTHDDTIVQADQLAVKTIHLRIFDDDVGKMNRSVLDVGGSILIVPQFTLYADLKGARRPSFSTAARPEIAEPLFDRYVSQVQTQGSVQVATGVFRAAMQVSLQNDGPVTIWLDTIML